LVVFATARRLFDGRAAVFATAAYAFFPLSVLWSANIHMQPLAMLPTGLGFFFLAGTLGARPNRAAALAGLCFGLSFYVRESALAAAAAAVLFIVATAAGWRDRARRIGALAAGFLVVGGIFVAGYSLVLTPSQLWDGPLNPLALPLRALQGLQTGVGPAESVQVPEAAPGRLEQQSVVRALANARLMGALGLFLFVGLAATLRGMRPAAWRAAGERREAAGFLLLWLWFGLLALAYGYWAFTLGFYPQYFTELVPPLAIAFGVAVPRAVERWAGRPLPAWLWVTAGLVLAASFAAGRAIELSTLVYLTTPALLLALGVAVVARRGGAAMVALGMLAAVIGVGFLPAMPGATAIKGAAGFTALAVAVVAVRQAGRPASLDFLVMTLAAGAAVLSMQRAGRVLSVSYQCVWPPDLLEPVATLIRQQSRPDETVMSGAVVWAFEAGRRPFLLISHPLKFLARHVPQERAEIEAGLATVPPKIVVLDGYTERTFGKVVPTLTRLLEQGYEPLGTWEGGRHPVRLYRAKGRRAAMVSGLD
jgi:hypothetical protein